MQAWEGIPNSGPIAAWAVPPSTLAFRRLVVAGSTYIGMGPRRRDLCSSRRLSHMF